MRRAVGGKKRDASEASIVAALRAIGARVEYLSGERAPDILVHFRGIWTPLEVKSAKGKQTPSQRETQYRIVRTPQEALAVIGCGIEEVQR